MRFSLDGVWERDKIYLSDVCACEYMWIVCESVWVQFSSVTQLCPTLCNPTDCSTPGLPVHHQLPVYSNSHTTFRYTQTHISNLEPRYPTQARLQSLSYVVLRHTHNDTHTIQKYYTYTHLTQIHSPNSNTSKCT